MSFTLIDFRRLLNRVSLVLFEKGSEGFAVFANAFSVMAKKLSDTCLHYGRNTNPELHVFAMFVSQSSIHVEYKLMRVERVYFVSAFIRFASNQIFSGFFPTQLFSS
jgi:hypothetical protein